MVSAPVHEGSVLAGKYRVERVLGAGAMGIVVAATHIHLGQRVALKFLMPHSCSQPGAVERFLREARAVVRIQSEHVARVSDVGTLEDGSPYMVMEYLQGMDLGQLLDSRGAMPIWDAVDHVLQAAEAIAEAHAAHIVHRDLKPANLFLCQRSDGSPLIKVLDFGISKLALSDSDGPSQVSMTSTSAVMGSPMYMSPEQIRSSKNVDSRTDIWSLGVILHQLITNRTVYESDTLGGLLAMVIADPPASLRNHLPDAPVELEQVILRCLEKDPARRFQNVAELAEALLPFAPARSRVSVERIAGTLKLPAPLQGVYAASGPANPAVATGGGASALVASTPAVAASSQPNLQVASSSGGAWGSTHQSTGSRSSLRVAALVGGFMLLVLGAGAFALYRLIPGRSSASDTAVPHPSVAETPPLPPPAVATVAVEPAPVAAASAPLPSPPVALAPAPTPSVVAPAGGKPSGVRSNSARPQGTRPAAQTAPAAEAHATPVPAPAAPARTDAPFDDRR
ncbi:MAG TPA: protein kinase [Polyangiaceae bacterium]|jgi:serine/threonine-protein kinase